jgi:hypothetical protein
MFWAKTKVTMVPFAAVMSAGVNTNGPLVPTPTLMLLADGVGAVAVDELEDWALTKTGRSRAVKVIENFMVRE